jgi:hypothetical protein
VCRQPRRDRGRRALGQQINHLLAFEIADHGPDPSVSPPGPCIEPNHAGDLKGREGRLRDQTHHHSKTPWYAQCAREPHPRAAATRNAHLSEGRTHA